MSKRKANPEFEAIDGARSRGEHEAALAARAEYYTAVHYKGFGRFDRREFPTLDGALSYAQDRADAENIRFLIYGIVGKTSVHLRNVNPKG